MSSLPYLETSAPFIKFGALLTLSVNSFLIYVTINRIKTINTAYKSLIILQAALGIFFSLIEILISPFIHSYNASFTFFSSVGVTSESLIIRLILLNAYSLICTIIICVLAIQFVYRYLVVLAPMSLDWFRGLRASFWILYVSFFSAVWVFALNQIFPDDYSDHYVSRELEQNYNVDVNHLASYQFVAYNEKGKLRFHNCLGISIITLIVTFQYIVVLFFGIKTHYGMKSIAASPSAKTRRLQTQLFKTLIFQVTVPTIFYNWPIFLLYLLPYANLKISFPSGVMIFFLNFYPAVDSLILMFLVGEYNITIREFIGLQPRRSASSTRRPCDNQLE